MNDYIIEERIFNSIKDNQKQTKNNQNNNQINKNKDLENIISNLEKLNLKLEKKNDILKEELKSNKLNFSNLKKDFQILTMANEKLISEKLNLEALKEENKNYIRKLESKLVNGTKNQYLIEINNKLRKEIESFQV